MTTPQELLDLLRQARTGLEEMALPMGFPSDEGRQAYFAGWSDALGELAAIIDQAERGDVEGLSRTPTPRELLAHLKQATPQDERPSDELKQLRMVGRSDALLDLDSIIYREEHPTTPEEQQRATDRLMEGIARQGAAFRQMTARSGPIYERSRERSRKMSAAWRAAGSPKRVEAFYARDGVTYHVRRADGSYELIWRSTCQEGAGTRPAVVRVRLDAHGASAGRTGDGRSV